MSKYKQDSDGILEEKKTEWNAALASLQRLHILLVNCNEYSHASMVGGYNKQMLANWRLTLLTLFREISPKLSEEEFNNIEGMLNNLDKLPNMSQISYDTLTDERIVKINRHIYIKYWRSLHNIEIKLRRLADSKGLLIPDKKTELDGLMDME